MARERPVLFALFGLNRPGQILWAAIFLIGGGAFFATRSHTGPFTDADEQLFRAARHGDRAGIEQALATGANVNAAAPTDGKTAVFRAAVFGYADAVRILIDRDADLSHVGFDGLTALEVVTAARGEEKDPAAAKALDDVAGVLRRSEPKR